MVKRLTVTAMREEDSLTDNYVSIVTGEGAINVMRSLADVRRDTPILSVGYAGSNSIPVGTRVRVGRVRLYHPNATYEEPEFELDGDVTCYTSSDFVTETDIGEPCVFDMELAYILAMGFTDVVAEKVVSDNLSIRQYHKTVIDDG